MQTPALRDQYGQAWPFPPIEGPDQPGHDKTWLIFIPGSYTPVCMSELSQVSDLANSLAVHQVGIRLIAPDSAPILRMVSEELTLRVPCLSDFWLNCAAARHYGILDEGSGRPHCVSLLENSSSEVVEIVVSTSRERDMEDHLAVMQKKK